MKEKIILSTARFLEDFGWDLLCTLIFITFSVSIWMPSRFFPLFWDSTYVVKTATEIAETNFTKFVSQQNGYAHPVLFPTILALLWRVWGTSPQVGHFLMLPFLPILLISAYFYFSSKVNRVLSFLGTMLLGFTPVVLAEYVNVYTDLPMAACIALSVLLWEKKRYMWWGVIFAIAILIKIPALAVAPFFFFSALSQKKRHLVLMGLLVPLITLTAWFCYHWYITGWWFMHVDSSLRLAVTENVFAIFGDAAAISFQFLTGQGKWLLSAIAVISGFLIWRSRQRMTKREIVALAIEFSPIIFGCLLFAATGEFAYRYAIMINIFFFSCIIQIGAYLSQKKLIPDIMLYAALVGVLVYFTTLWHPQEKSIKSFRFAPPSDLSIIDYLQVFRWLTTYVEVNNKAVFYGGFPENISLLEPKMGFVSKPMRFQACEEFSYQKDETQIIIMHPFSPTTLPCQDLIKSLQLAAFTGKEVNGKWIDLFLVSSTSAQKKL